MKGIGIMAKHQAKANLFMWTVMFMRANGEMIKHQGKEYIHIITEPNIMGAGYKIISMATVFNRGWMGASMKECINKVKKMVKGNTYGRMGVITMAIGRRTKSQATEYMFGLMVEDIKGSG